MKELLEKMINYREKLNLKLEKVSYNFKLIDDMLHSGVTVTSEDDYNKHNFYKREKTAIEREISLLNISIQKLKGGINMKEIRIGTLSPHDTKFWNGTVVKGNPEMAKKMTLTDDSRYLYNISEFEIREFKKVLSPEQKEELNEYLATVDICLCPALFSTVDLNGVTSNKLFAFNATPETQRSKPDEKIASNILTPIH